MKRNLIGWMTVAAMALPLYAWADSAKDVRDKMTELKIDDHVSDAIKGVKSSCGLDVKIDIDRDSFSRASAVTALKNSIDEVAKFAAAYCSDAPSKKEFAVIKSFKFSYDDHSESATLDKGTGVMATKIGPSTYISAAGFRRAIDKTNAK